MNGLEIRRLADLGLPPITSVNALATMIGVNQGLVWSLANRTARHYRIFTIPKGKGFRRIQAPRIALKVIQKWLSIHLERKYSVPSHVYGFVQGRSHIDAAERHVKSQWVLSVDIEDFFPTTPAARIVQELMRLGYASSSAMLISRLACLNGYLSQGSPASPILSNFAFREMDISLAGLAEHFGAQLSRYADDITFSSVGEYPSVLLEQIERVFSQSVWKIATHKTQLSLAPHRLKVHGLLVHGDKIRLTKGYRNKLRAYRHSLAAGKVRDEDLATVIGHLTYEDQVERRR